MKNLKLNETPMRTSRNFNINNIKLSDIRIPEKIGSFNNIKVCCETSKIKIIEDVDDYNVTYGLSDYLINQVKKDANNKIKLVVDSTVEKEVSFEFNFDEKNKDLISNIEIVTNENTKAVVILKFNTLDKVEGYNNLLLKIFARNNSNLKVILVNNLNLQTNNFISIENEISDDAKIDFTIIDLGGKNSITNYYSNLIGKNSDNKINTIYLGEKSQIFDLNYIAHLRGEKSNVDIEVQGALKDTSKKHFKGTIDFKKGAKKAKGNENESCILLSDTAKSLSLPMLLCSEEDVEGNHSNSAGKIGQKELFYIMSRGFELKEAMKLMVKAKFNEILKNIKNEELKEEILLEIDKKLD